MRLPYARVRSETVQQCVVGIVLTRFPGFAEPGVVVLVTGVSGVLEEGFRGVGDGQELGGAVV